MTAAGCGEGDSPSPVAQANGTTAPAASRPSVECRVEYGFQSGVNERRVVVPLPYNSRKTLVFRNLEVEVTRSGSGQPWPNDSIGLSIRRRGSNLPIDTALIRLPDFRTEALVNQAQEYGFTGRHSTYYHGEWPRALSVVRWWCRAR